MNDIKKYIKIGNDNTIPVVDVYSYIYDFGDGKQVLRITIDPKVLSYEEIYEKLGNNQNTIYEYHKQNDILVDSLELMAEHTYYYKDFKCSYNNDPDHSNMFSIEICRESAVEIQARLNQQILNETNMVIAESFEIK